MSEVLLLGGSIPALVAALELAKVGIKVRIADVSAQLPQRPVRDPGNEIVELLDELASPIAAGSHPERRLSVVSEAPVQTWLLNRDSVPKPQPFPSLFGIPTTVPITAECVDMLGTGGVFRAYLDRVKPLLTIGKQENFAKLVESRLGKAARELLVEPIVFERFGVSAAEVEVSIIAPGLNEALTRAGSLTGSALQQLERHVARETVLMPEGGWSELETQLRERLELFGATTLNVDNVSLVRIPVSEADDENGAGGADGAAEQGEWIMTGYDNSGELMHRFAAIIVDERIPATSSATADTSESGFGQAFEAMAPELYRAYAEIGIEAPGEDILGADVDTAVDDSLRILTDSSGARWAARLHRSGTGSEAGWVLKCSGSTVTRTEAQASIDRVSDLADLAGARRLDADARVWIEAAPRTTHAVRDAQELAIKAWSEEWPEVLLCSELYTGGELGLAISHARAQAIGLRRRLTGIAE